MSYQVVRKDHVLGMRVAVAAIASPPEEGGDWIWMGIAA